MIATPYLVVALISALALLVLQRDRLRGPRPSLTPSAAERVLLVAALLLWVIGISLLLFGQAAS